jgi:hypothetical protein
MSDEARWISVGELAQAFAPDNNTPRCTDELAGTTLRLHLENGQMVEHEFLTGTKLIWRMLEGSGAGREAEETYVANKVRDLHLGIVTVLVARLPERAEARRPLADRVESGQELTSVRAVFLAGAVNGRFTPDTPRHGPTTELIGRRVEYTYSATERYEHIYLNEDFYTWHCLLGSEKGLADTDRCHYHKLANDLHFFVWREKIVPTLGAVVVDFDLMRTVGKIFGYQGGDVENPVNFPVGAHARLLNVTRRDDGQPREPELL